MNTSEKCRLTAKKSSEKYKSHTCEDDYSSDTCTERIDQYEDGENKEKEASEYHPTAATKLKGIEIAAQGNHHETMIH